MNRTEEQTLALAAVFQAASIVHEIAAYGRFNEDDLQTCLQSILVTNPDSIIDVFGDAEKLHTGLRVLINQLGTVSTARQVDIARYVISLLHLQQKLKKRSHTQARIGEGIERVTSQLTHYELTHANVLANLAGIYSDTISQIPPKVMVNGEQQHLANPDNVNRIRALLLAGIRAAVLWRQLGGSRWHILFKRKRLVETAQRLLTTA